MSGVTFNRNRVRLKKVLGIRARLALLAVMLVAPLMLDRVRTLENFRTSQIAQAAAGYANVTARAAETQREVVSSVETMPTKRPNRSRAAAVSALSIAPPSSDRNASRKR